MAVNYSFAKFLNLTTGSVKGEGFDLWWGYMIPAHLVVSH